jgi:hypothetical protein
MVAAIINGKVPTNINCTILPLDDTHGLGIIPKTKEGQDWLLEFVPTIEIENLKF